MDGRMWTAQKNMDKSGSRAMKGWTEKRTGVRQRTFTEIKTSRQAMSQNRDVVMFSLQVDAKLKLE